MTQTLTKSGEADRDHRLARRDETVKLWRENPNSDQIAGLWHLAYLDGEAACLAEQAFDYGWGGEFAKMVIENPWFHYAKPASPTYWRVVGRTVKWLSQKRVWLTLGHERFMRKVADHLGNLLPSEVEMWAETFVRRMTPYVDFLAEQRLTVAIPALTRWVMEVEGAENYTNLHEVLINRHKPMSSLALLQLLAIAAAKRKQERSNQQEA